MAEYTPPLRDIRFVLTHIVDLEALTGLPDFAHADPDVVFGALAEAGRMVAEVIAPTNRDGDVIGSTFEDGEVVTPASFKKAYAEYRAGGWGSIPFPEEWGGAGFPWVVGAAVTELVKTANMAFSLCPMLTASAIEALLAHGDDELKATYAEKMVTGEWTGTMHLTEPQAGSDVGALTARAEPAGDGTWRIFGQKIFITYGEHDLADNIIHFVLARTPDSPPGTRGISLFVVPKYLVGPDGSLGDRNDVRALSIEHKLGIHASPTCVMSFGDEGGAVGYLVGEERRGMRQMFTMMNNARLAVGIEGLAIAERAYQQALHYARERRQGRAVGAPAGTTSPIIDHPDVRRMLMTMKANIEALRALLYVNAEAIDRAHHHTDPEERADARARADLLTPVSKAWGTDLGVEVASIGVQVHGGMGYVEETGAAQHFRDARIAPIYEGTNGIQAIDLVTRKLPMDGGKVVGRYLQEIAAFDEPLRAAGLEEIARHLAGSTAVLSRATRWLLDRRDEPADVLAGATPYLRMFGTVAGGYYLARSALAAVRALEEGPDPFLDAKVATASFYAAQLLPQADGLLPAVTRGAEQLYAVAADTLGPA